MTWLRILPTKINMKTYYKTLKLTTSLKSVDQQSFILSLVSGGVRCDACAVVLEERREERIQWKHLRPTVCI